MADSNGTEQVPHWVEWLKYAFGFLAALFGYLWRRQVNRVDKLDEAIQRVERVAITSADLTSATNSIRHAVDGLASAIQHQSDRIDKLYEGRNRDRD